MTQLPEVWCHMDDQRAKYCHVKEPKKRGCCGLGTCQDRQCYLCTVVAKLPQLAKTIKDARLTKLEREKAKRRMIWDEP